MKAKVIFLAILTLGICLPGLAQAQMEGETLHISIMGGYLFPNNKVNLENGPLVGLGLGYNFTKNWGLEAFGYFAPDLKNDGRWNLNNHNRNNDVTMARLSGLYHFDTGTKFTPYVSVGVGGQWISRDDYDNYESFAVNAALGFKYFFNEVVALRVEANDAYGFRKRGVDDVRFNAPVVSAGLTFQLGSNSPTCLDSDSDGVCDAYDKCPGTPAGYKVDADGCPITVSISLNIKFDFDKAIVKPQYNSEVQKVADFLISHPNSDTVVEGHTDNKGSDAYNLKLSQRRADAVRDSLIKKFNISPTRVQAVGYGETRPIADNATESGRAENRRVVGVISGSDVDR
jgi:OOP family OmpA-OmpF porin